MIPFHVRKTTQPLVICIYKHPINPTILSTKKETKGRSFGSQTHISLIEERNVTFLGLLLLHLFSSQIEHQQREYLLHSPLKLSYLTTLGGYCLEFFGQQLE